MKSMGASEVSQNEWVRLWWGTLLPVLAALSSGCTRTKDLGLYPQNSADAAPDGSPNGAQTADGGDGMASDRPQTDTPGIGDTHVASDVGDSSDGTRPIAQVWTPGPPMLRVHQGHTATLLPNGKVLVIGGSTAELYDPAIDDWLDAGTVSNGRYNHTATLLANGKVLLVGGSAGDNPPLDAELYDIDTNTWSNAGTLTASLSSHTATVLEDGRVLIAGQPLVTLYDPVTNSFAPAPPMLQPRFAHRAALIGGRVVVAGGVTSPDESISSVEGYDPARNRWLPMTPMNQKHVENTATLLADGRLLMAGGSGGVELYDPTLDRWTSGAPLLHPRANHTAALLPNGTVLVAGGDDVTLNVATAEIYDPARDVWTSVGMLKQARFGHTATLLNGRVLITGGFDYANLTALSTTEVYQIE